MEVAARAALLFSVEGGRLGAEGTEPEWASEVPED